MTGEDLRKAVRQATLLGVKFTVVGADVDIAGDLPDDLRAVLQPDLLRDYFGAESLDNEALEFVESLGVEPVLISDIAGAERAMHELTGAPEMSLDGETGPPGGCPTSVCITKTGCVAVHQAHADKIGLDPHRAKFQLLQLFAGTKVAYVFWGEAAQYLANSAWLRQQHLIIHSADFELSFLQHHHGAAGAFLHPIEDTRQACGLLHGTWAGRSLEDAYRLTFGGSIPKELQTSCWSAPRLSAGQVAYAAMDAIVAFDCWQEMRPQLEAKGRLAAYELQRDAAPAVASMRVRGIGFDKAEHERQVDIWSREYADALRTYHDLTGEAPPTKPAEIAAWVEKVAGDQLERWPRTPKTGALSTKTDHLKKLTLSPIPTVRPVLAILAKKKLLESFGLSLHQHINPVTGRIHGNFHIGATKAGRFSASEPNMQQLPAACAVEFKKAFVAAPGNVLVCGDWSQIELRGAAFITGDPTLTQMFAEGRDLHTEMAARITGIPIDQVTKEQRDAAKSVNFGALYGISAASLAEDVFATYGVEMTEAEARAALDAFFRTYPILRQWMFDHYFLCRDRGYVEIGCGRVVEAAWEYQGHFRFTQTCNLPVQGLAADCMLRALPMVHHNLAGLRGGLCATVHDELLVEVAERDADRARHILKETMIEAFEMTFPGAPIKNVVKVNIGPNWAAAK
jgi:DNA polymerase I-like protein with 3'-5' exonuclease and polymerase domains